MFWFCHLSGRFSGILISRFVHIKYIVIGDAIGAWITTILLVMYGNQSVTALWILVGFFGFFCSIVFPAGTYKCYRLAIKSLGLLVLLNTIFCCILTTYRSIFNKTFLKRKRHSLRLDICEDKCFCFRYDMGQPVSRDEPHGNYDSMYRLLDRRITL